MTIRPATPTDASAIAAVERAAASRPWSPDAIRASLELPTTRAWVAEESGIVGHLIASSVLDEGEVLTVAVHPEHRRRGIARELLSACEHAWVRAGVRRAYLDVRTDNAAAIALYEGLGWVRAGVRAGYYADGSDALQLVREVR